MRETRAGIGPAFGREISDEALRAVRKSIEETDPTLLEDRIKLEQSLVDLSAYLDVNELPFKSNNRVLKQVISEVKEKDEANKEIKVAWKSAAVNAGISLVCLKLASAEVAQRSPLLLMATLLVCGINVFFVGHTALRAFKTKQSKAMLLDAEKMERTIIVRNMGKI